MLCTTLRKHCIYWYSCQHNRPRLPLGTEDIDYGCMTFSVSSMLSAYMTASITRLEAFKDFETLYLDLCMTRHPSLTSVACKHAAPLGRCVRRCMTDKFLQTETVAHALQVQSRGVHWTMLTCQAVTMPYQAAALELARSAYLSQLCSHSSASHQQWSEPAKACVW